MNSCCLDNLDKLTVIHPWSEFTGIWKALICQTKTIILIFLIVVLFIYFFLSDLQHDVGAGGFIALSDTSSY